MQKLTPTCLLTAHLPLREQQSTARDPVVSKSSRRPDCKHSVSVSKCQHKLNGEQVHESKAKQDTLSMIHQTLEQMQAWCGCMWSWTQVCCCRTGPSSRPCTATWDRTGRCALTTPAALPLQCTCCWWFPGLCLWSWTSSRKSAVC